MPWKRRQTMPSILSAYPLPAVALATLGAVCAITRGLAWIVIAVRAREADLPAIARALGSSYIAISRSRTSSEGTVSPN
jgi:hypothetical protein